MVATPQTRVARTDPPSEAPVSPDKPAAAAPRAPVEYERDGPAGGRVSVRGFRLLVGLTLVNTVLLASSVMGPQLFPFLRAQWQEWQAKRAAEKVRQAHVALQQQCLAHAAPAGQVVYDEDPARAAKLHQDGGGAYGPPPRLGRPLVPPPGWVPPAALKPPQYYLGYLDAIFTGRIAGATDPVLFLGERKTSAGVPHVVVVQLRSETEFEMRGADGESIDQTGPVFRQTKRRRIVARAWPAGPGGPRGAAGKGADETVELALPDRESRRVAYVPRGTPLGAAVPIDYGNTLRFFAGIPDPADPTRFTIPYEIDGRQGVIEGFLKDGGFDLRAAGAKWVYADYGQAWDLSAAGAATKPAAE